MVALSKKLDADSAFAGRMAPELIRAGSYLTAGIIIGVAAITMIKKTGA